MIASQNGPDDVIELLLKWNVSINTQNKAGMAAIYSTSWDGHNSIISTLLKNGRDPNLAVKDHLL